jgi:hypothetical protein
MEVRDNMLLQARGRRQEIIDLYDLDKLGEQEKEEELNRVWNTIGTDKNWFFDMEVHMVARILKYPLVVVSDTYKNFEVLDTRDEDFIRNHIFISNIHESHFNLLFPLRESPIYPSFAPFPASIFKGFAICLAEHLRRV